MKRLSQKDLIIALGIVVAAVIIITSVYAREIGTQSKEVKIIPDKKIKPAAVIWTVVGKFSSSTSL